jgi:hypothetical protein
MASAQTPETPICNETDDDHAKVANAVCVFSKPLLVGASLTSGVGSIRGGPSLVIAENLSPGADDTNISMAGTSSLISLKLKHKFDEAKPPSIVMGIDLFFWDAAKNKCGEEFITSTQNFIKMYRDKNIPMILGKLPKGVSFPAGYRVLNTNDCADKINTLLEQECKLEANCIIYDPKDCLGKITPEQRPTFFVDSHHTSVAGNDFCAKEFIASKKYEDLKCKKN